MEQSDGMWTSAVEARPRFSAMAFRELAAWNALVNADAAVGMWRQQFPGLQRAN